MSENLTSTSNQVQKKDLKVTKGTISETESGFLTVTDSKVRAVEKTGTAKSALIRFRFRGSTNKVKPLDSGIVRRQIGLKMRAKNTCNLLYIMWQIENDRDHREFLKIQVKRNPGMKYHNSCGSNGYVKPPIAFVPLGNLASAKDQKTHTLRADISGRGSVGYDLVVNIDDQEVWNGTIPTELLHDIDGPAGFRTDNGSFIFKMFTRRKRVRDHRD